MRVVTLETDATACHGPTMKKPAQETEVRSVRLATEMWQRIKVYRHTNLIASEAQAIRDLIEKGFAVERVVERSK